MQVILVLILSALRCKVQSESCLTPDSQILANPNTHQVDASRLTPYSRKPQLDDGETRLDARVTSMVLNNVRKICM